MDFGRKVTSGKYHKQCKRKLINRIRQAIVVKLGNEKKMSLRTMGGNIKTRIVTAQFVNLIGKDRKAIKAKIKNVLETPSNKFLVRQNVLVKGAIIETERGKARITNRPSQEGSVQAVLIE